MNRRLAISCAILSYYLVFGAPLSALAEDITDINQASVVLFDDNNFKDRKLTVKYPNEVADMDKVHSDDGKEGFGDKASSVRWTIPSGWQCVLYEDKNFKGKSHTLDGNGQTQEHVNLDDQKFGDECSSLRFLQMPTRAQTVKGWSKTISGLNTSPQDLYGIAEIKANNSCGFDADNDTISVPGATYNKGEVYQTDRIKNKDRVGLSGFRIVSGLAKVYVDYHKSGWRRGLELVIGPTQEPHDICWRNPHWATPDVRVGVEFLENTEITPFKINFRDD